MTKGENKDVLSQAAAIARSYNQVPDGVLSLKQHVRVPETDAAIYNNQTPTERGDCWRKGLLITRSTKLLHEVLAHVSGQAVSAAIVDHSFTLVVGGVIFEGETDVDVLLKAIAHFMQSPQTQFDSPTSDDYERHLAEMGLLEG